MKPFLLSLTALAVLASCSDSPDTTASVPGQPTVYAVNYPLAFFAETMAGDDTGIKVVFPEIDGDPAFWKPSDKDVAGFQGASLILMNGATYSKWAAKVSLPESIQRDTSAAFAGDYITVTEAATHSHGNGEAHAHAGTAFTTWIDLQQAIWQAEEVRDALIELAPEHEKAITDRFNKVADELDALHAELIAIGKQLKDRPLVGSHPIYQYMSRRYKLNLREVHWEPDVVPDEAGMKELKEKLVDHDAKVMIWEDAPVSESVDKLNELGISSIVFNPAGNRPESGDFLTVMRENVKNLRGLAGE